MKYITLLLLTIVSLFAIKDSHEANAKMSWEDSYRYCFSMSSKIASIDEFEKKYAEKKRGMDPGYAEDTYWTRNSIDIYGAYSFEFNLGLSMPDHKAKKYRVLCVK
jgi:hypothetical protein